MVSACKSVLSRERNGLRLGPCRGQKPGNPAEYVPLAGPRAQTLSGGQETRITRHVGPLARARRALPRVEPRRRPPLGEPWASGSGSRSGVAPDCNGTCGPFQPITAAKSVCPRYIGRACGEATVRRKRVSSSQADRACGARRASASTTSRLAVPCSPTATPQPICASHSGWRSRTRSRCRRPTPPQADVCVRVDSYICAGAGCAQGVQ